jgi:hypothetical protein
MEVADSSVTQGSILIAETASRVAETRIGGRFIALDVLGRGGMAEVYRVRDEVSGRELALKRLRKERVRSGGQALALFQREYQTLAQLSHPCIIQVFDYGVDDGGAFYTMELLDTTWRRCSRCCMRAAGCIEICRRATWCACTPDTSS